MSRMVHQKVIADYVNLIRLRNYKLAMIYTTNSKVYDTVLLRSSVYRHLCRLRVSDSTA